MYAYENKIVHVYLRALVFPAIQSSYEHCGQQTYHPKEINNSLLVVKTLFLALSIFRIQSFASLALAALRVPLASFSR